jgi:hypothetical protein
VKLDDIKAFNNKLEGEQCGKRKKEPTICNVGRPK